MDLVRVEDTPLFLGLQVRYWADVVGVKHFDWFFSVASIQVRSRETVVLLGVSHPIRMFRGDVLSLDRKEP